MTEPSSRLFRIVEAWKCRGTHHRLAMEALKHLDCDHGPAWQRLFLSEADQYLTGSKAPDKTFRDFRNHVLHIEDEDNPAADWGGAIVAATTWYRRLLATLAERDWEKVAYVGGVLSHYCTDIWMPLHTGQTEDESRMHRACEWSVSKSYADLRDLRPLPEFPEFEHDQNWLALAVREAAATARLHYDVLVRNYDLDAGVADPLAGLTDPLRDRLADCLAGAVGLWSRVLSRALEESGIEPPEISLTLRTVIEGIAIPIHWVTKKLADAHDREVVLDIYNEWRATGTVEETLPQDDRCVRNAWRRHLADREPIEPPRTEIPSPDPVPAPIDESAAKDSIPFGRLPEADPGLNFHLETARPVEAAPSIGPKTARRLETVGITTVADLLRQDPDHAASVLGVRHITPTVLRDWQAQAGLVCRVPELRGHDAQFLVAIGVRNAETLAASDPEWILRAVTDLLATPTGARILRGGEPPDLAEVTRWITRAKAPRTLAAA